MKRFILLLFVITIISIVGCEDEAVVIAEKEMHTFAGLVIDSLTLLPLDSVSISFIDTIGSSFTGTDSLGKFEDIYIGGDVIEIFAQKVGYFTKSQLIDLRLNPDSILFELVKQ